ncbi:hypothetical protein DPMN_127629 [Dreissena polymorpha]|uniref:Uncharacterized protein n=1 Tax=Dreissena polymorpha TaxID=45954 RepID=A0A9D4H1K9_DREPO|nr:hypothetical protein DPMN_127629 [Dreissena polymorpha]
MLHAFTEEILVGVSAGVPRHARTMCMRAARFLRAAPVLMALRRIVAGSGSQWVTLFAERDRWNCRYSNKFT